MRGNGVQEEVEMEYCRRVGVPLKTDTSFVLPSCSQGGGRDEDGRGVLCPIAIFEVPALYPLSDTFRFRTTELSQLYNGQCVLVTCLSCLDTWLQSGKGNWGKNGSSRKGELFVNGIYVGLFLRGQCHSHEERERLSELTLLWGLRLREGEDIEVVRFKTSLEPLHFAVRWRHNHSCRTFHRRPCSAL